MSESSLAKSECLGLSASELAGKIVEGELSAAQAVEEHIARIEAVNDRLNAVVSPRFEEARREAAVADEALRQGRQPGLLHGVPITVKDAFDVAGLPTTIGLTNRADHVAAEDCPLVARLRGAGAIVLGKTNLAQLSVLAESDNRLFGRTNNPWNLDRSSGGSSGGEAAIIAASGSCLGLGSDGGGSIRGPANWCGIHGFKPTRWRLSQLGHAITLNWHQEVIQPGPLAHTVADLSLAMRVMIGQVDEQPYDPTVFPIPWQDPNQVDLAGLRVGVYTDDGLLEASPAVRRAVEEAADQLRGLGMSVEEFQPLQTEEAWRLYYALISAEGWKSMKRASFFSRRDWRVRRLLWINSAPTLIRRPLARVLEWIGQDREADLFRAVPRRHLSAYQYRQLRERHIQYEQRFVAEMERRKLDILLCPATATPAPRHGSFYGSYFYTYSMLYNLLGLPAGVVAATRVREEESAPRPRVKCHVQRQARGAEKQSAGLPIGVQVVARHWQDHQALAVMAALEEVFRGGTDYPHRPPLD